MATKGRDRKIPPSLARASTMLGGFPEFAVPDFIFARPCMGADTFGASLAPGVIGLVARWRQGLGTLGLSGSRFHGQELGCSREAPGGLSSGVMGPRKQIYCAPNHRKGCGVVPRGHWAGGGRHPPVCLAASSRMARAEILKLGCLSAAPSGFPCPPPPLCQSTDRVPAGGGSGRRRLPACGQRMGLQPCHHLPIPPPPPPNAPPNPEGREGRAAPCRRRHYERR